MINASSRRCNSASTSSPSRRRAAELEPLERAAAEARIAHGHGIGTGTSRALPHVAEFVETIKKRTGACRRAHLVRARLVWTCALRGEGQFPSIPWRWQALQDFQLRRRSRCRRTRPSTGPARQLLATLFVGNAQASGEAPDDLFKVTDAVKGADIRQLGGRERLQDTWPAWRRRAAALRRNPRLSGMVGPWTPGASVQRIIRADRRRHVSR